MIKTYPCPEIWQAESWAESRISYTMKVGPAFLRISETTWKNKITKFLNFYKVGIQEYNAKLFQNELHFHLFLVLVILHNISENLYEIFNDFVVSNSNVKIEICLL